MIFVIMEQLLMSDNSDGQCFLPSQFDGGQRGVPEVRMDVRSDKVHYEGEVDWLTGVHFRP